MVSWKIDSRRTRLSMCSRLGEGHQGEREQVWWGESVQHGGGRTGGSVEGVTSQTYTRHNMYVATYQWVSVDWDVLWKLKLILNIRWGNALGGWVEVAGHCGRWF